VDGLSGVCLFVTLYFCLLSNVKVKGQGYRGQKKEKVRHFVWESSSGAQSSAISTPVGKSAHAV